MVSALKAESGSQSTVGDVIAELLEAQGVTAAFGVISIHNMAILDAIGRRGAIHFVPSRGEAGGLNMADGYARVAEDIGVAFTSTGTAAGNAAGALVEALTAGSPVIHITGQIETSYLDQNRAYIHEAPAQLEMLRAVSKAAYRISYPEQVVEVFEAAFRDALTPPTGPVSVEIPIDVQAAPLSRARKFERVRAVAPALDERDVAAVSDALIRARRPMLMLGGGARHARKAATRLADMGIGIVTSTNGRAVVDESHEMSLGAFNVSEHVQELYKRVEMLIVAGSRLRSNETWTYELELPENLIRVDVDPKANGRNYPNARFVHADCQSFLEALAHRIAGKLQAAPEFAKEIASVRERSVHDLATSLGPYADLVRILQSEMPPDSVWVRDVTISNSMWGNRWLRISSPNKGIHAVGGGIGQGLPMAVGAAVAAGSKVLLLTGDGGLSLCLGELITAAEQGGDLTVLLMNDRGYGVIRNIQDVHYGGRKLYSNILTPNFSDICRSLAIPHRVASTAEGFRTALEASLGHRGLSVVEVDMLAIGPFRRNFAGPPIRAQ